MTDQNLQKPSQRSEPTPQKLLANRIRREIVEVFENLAPLDFALVRMLVEQGIDWNALFHQLIGNATNNKISNPAG